MLIPDALTCAMTMLPATAATWAACRLAYGRQLKASQRRIDKLNQARLLYDRHGAQVRRQLEHLKRELDLQRAQQPWSPPTAPPAPVTGARHGADYDAPSLPPDGFAPTVPAEGFAPTRPMSWLGHVAATDGRDPAAPDGFAPTRPFDGFAPTRPMSPSAPPPTLRARDLGRQRQVG